MNDEPGTYKEQRPGINTNLQNVQPQTSTRGFAFGNGTSITTGATLYNIQGRDHTINNFYNNLSSEGPWNQVLKEVDKYGGERVKAWKEDVAINLILAGLMTLALAVFTIQSYSWLSQDPAVALLAQISQQLSSSSTTASNPTLPFHPSSSVIRINCFWFLSLITTTTCTLVGLLCRQWLTEHFEETDTHTPEESIALQRLRIESLHRWGVVFTIRALPVLLQSSLMLFFVGLLESLWLRHRIVFAIAAAAAGIGFVVYYATTFLPTIRILRRVFTIDAYSNLNPTSLLDNLPLIESLCPYKSLQSWLVYSALTRAILAYPSVVRLRYIFSKRFSVGRLRRALRDLGAISNWSSFDLHILRNFQNVDPELRVYEVMGLEWLLRTFRGTSYSHLGIVHALASSWNLVTSVAASVAFNQWNLCVWRPLNPEDIGKMVEDPDSFFADERAKVGLGSHPPPIQSSPSHPLITQLLLYEVLWGRDIPDWELRYDTTEALYQMNVPQALHTPFIVPFYRIEELWKSCSHKERELGLSFLRFYEYGWGLARSLDGGHHDQLALVTALTEHIRHNEHSALKDSAGIGFIIFVNKSIIEERLFENGAWVFADIKPRWQESLGRLSLEIACAIELPPSRTPTILSLEPSAIEPPPYENPEDTFTETAIEMRPLSGPDSPSGHESSRKESHI